MQMTLLEWLKIILEVAAALAAGKSQLTGVLDSEDTRVMIDSLAKLGFVVNHQLEAADPAARSINVVGQGGNIPAAQAELFIANSGTSVMAAGSKASWPGARTRPCLPQHRPP